MSKTSAPYAHRPSKSHGRWIATGTLAVMLPPPTLETTVQTVADRPEAPIAIRTDLGAISSHWNSVDRDADHIAVARRRREDVEAPGAWWRCRRATGALCATSGGNAVEDGQILRFVVIQEAGLDGFWIYRAPQNEGIESHVVDPASIATSRRRRRAKTDRIDGDALVRADRQVEIR